MPKFYIGHGRHWDFFKHEGRSDSEFMSLCHAIYRSKGIVLYERGDVSLIAEPEKEFAIALLVREEQICSAFPYVDGGYTWPIELIERYEWPDPIEAQLKGSCHGAGINWFDPHYWAHKSRYKEISGPMNFQINALAYRIWKTEFDSEEKAHMAGMKGYMPLLDEKDYVAGKDEIQFTSHVEAVRSLNFYSIHFDIYTITIALPDDFPMRLNLYTPSSASESAFAAGDSIGGICWLFGKLRWTDLTGAF